MEYEGIYRKTGGNAQCKQITQLFERGKYETFDLTNADDFNDISAITSVLKNYFRNLPDPVFTHKLHESFIAAANIRGVDNKKQALCALLQELPKAHYDTLKVLMLHLNRVTAKSDINLMTSQNIGVVFGRESRSGIFCCSSTDPSHPAPFGGPQPRVWRHGGQGAQRAVDGRERAVRVPRGARVDRLMRECVVRAAGP